MEGLGKSDQPKDLDSWWMMQKTNLSNEHGLIGIILKLKSK